MMLLVLALGCLAGAGFLLSDFATQPARQRRVAVSRASTYGKIVLKRGDTRPFRERALVPFATRVARAVLRLSPKTSVEQVSAKLLQAGVALSPTTYLALKGGSAASGFALGVIFGASVKGAAAGLLMGLVLALLGWVVPEYLLSSRVKARREEIRSALPDALDLLSVSVEAGLGFDASITKITENMEGPLANEFALMLGEMRVGEGRADALKKMEQRVGAPELSSFVRSIIQADQLGISLGRILRVQATDTRLRRQAAAEEKAMKAPIKMLFPTVLFIFPSMFIVILGPAMLNFMTLFKTS
ncbi:MAG TPA: type II secretion system F family protein [Gaiellaceae bacterium]|jgi:tight adherence protein C